MKAQKHQIPVNTYVIYTIGWYLKMLQFELVQSAHWQSLVPWLTHSRYLHDFLYFKWCSCCAMCFWSVKWCSIALAMFLSSLAYSCSWDAACLMGMMRLVRNFSHEDTSMLCFLWFNNPFRCASYSFTVLLPHFNCKAKVIFR